MEMSFDLPDELYHLWYEAVKEVMQMGFFDVNWGDVTAEQAQRMLEIFNRLSIEYIKEHYQ